MISTIVPKRAMFFWGNDKMSWLRYMSLWSFCKYNPTWKVQLYRIKQERFEKYWADINQQDFFRYDGADYSDRLQDISQLEVLDWESPAIACQKRMGPSHLSNVFKWQQMAEEGGVYLDLDILSIKPIEDWYTLVNHSSSLCHNAKGRAFSIGLLGSCGGSQFYADVLTSSLEGFDPAVYQSAGVESIYRLFGGNRRDVQWADLVARYPDELFVNFAMQYVYPWNCSNIREYTSRVNTVVPAKTFGLHWYAGSEESQHMNISLTELSVATYHSTVAHFLRKML